MGAECARVYPTPPADERLQKVIELLSLQKRDIAKLHELFKRYDLDGSGTIDTTEFYELTHEKESVFANSIFEIIETNKPHELDFSEFVQALCTYCMFGKDEVLKFCFYIFDKDKNGYIEEDEMNALVKILHDNSVNHSLKMAIASLDEDGDGKINFGARHIRKCVAPHTELHQRAAAAAAAPWMYATSPACARARSRVQGHERALPTGAFPRVSAAVEHDAAHDDYRLVAEQAPRD